MGSQVIGEDRSQLPRRATVGEIRRGGRRASDRTKEKVCRFTVRIRQVVGHASALALAMTDIACREAEM